SNTSTVMWMFEVSSMARVRYCVTRHRFHQVAPRDRSFRTGVPDGAAQRIAENSSRQVQFDLRQQTSEIEPIGTGGPSRREDGNGPIAGFGRKIGVQPACLAAKAVVLVVGEESRQVAEFGLRPGRK